MSMSVPVAETTAAAEWLAAADPDPEHARAWLGSATIVMLPLGSLFEAVKVEDTHADALGVPGPIIRDGGGRCRFYLVPVGTRATWDVDGIECLGDTCYLTVPVPARTAGPGPFWEQAPDGTGTLVDPVALAAALTSSQEDA